MEIRKKNSIQRIQPNLQEHRERLIAEGEDRIQESRKSTRAFAERAKQTADRKRVELSRGRDTIDLSAEALNADLAEAKTVDSAERAREANRTRQEYVESLRERYSAGENLATPELVERAAGNILREQN